MTTTLASDQASASPGTARLRSVELAGPAGRLEAILNEGAADAPFVALLCHPHPLGGGTMHNKVVYSAMKAVNDPQWGLGWPVLRFNFRGTGLSQGEHHGEAEAEDVQAALDWLTREFTQPVVALGFSFGAVMTLRACCSHGYPGVRALAALGLPAHARGRDFHYPFLENCTLPKLFLSGDHDQFAPAAQLSRVVASAAEPKRLVLIHGADHFFTSHLVAMQSSLSGWLKERLQ